MAPTGLADGTCRRTNVKLGAYDPDCVYVMQQIGTTELFAVVDLAAPDNVGLALPDISEHMGKIRPDGTLMYLRGGNSLHPTMFADVVADPSAVKTEAEATANDRKRVTPACGTERPSKFFVAPDGEVIYQCNENFETSSWFVEAESKPLLQLTDKKRRYPKAAGPGRTLLVMEGGGDDNKLSIVFPSRTVSAGVVWTLFAARWVNDAFYVVTGTEGTYGPISLVRVDDTGRQSLVGTYGIDDTAASGPMRCVVEPTLTVVCTEQKEIVRYSTKNEKRELLFTSSNEPILITGY